MQRILLMLVLAVLMASMPTESAASAPGGPIAFSMASDVKDDWTNFDVYVMDADGGNVRRLTHDPGWDIQPSWSPDGTQIAFENGWAGYSGGDVDIYVMDADGGNVRRLTYSSNLREHYVHPTWSPNGTQIMFASDRDANDEIYVMDADGGNIRRLTNNSPGTANPVWWRGSSGTASHCSPGQQAKFVLGFAFLKSLLGDKMGQPIECEHANPENGDTLQNTTTGLSFYRKSTNTPTFTNGWEHWGWTIQGLVYWTGDSIDPPASAVPAPSAPTPPTPTATPTPTTPPTPAPPPQPESPISAGLSVLSAQQGQVQGLRDVWVTLSGMQDRIVFDQLPSNTFGLYNLGTRSATLSNALRNESAEVIAMVLAHEGQHALDQNLGRIPGDSSSCYNSEVRAFDIQIYLWQSLWGSGGKTGSLTSTERIFNLMSEFKQEDPIGYVARLIDLYGAQCET